MSTIYSTIISIIAEAGVMKDPVDDTSQGSIDIDSFVIPTGDELRHYPLQDLACYLPGRLIEDIGEMVLG